MIFEGIAKRFIAMKAGQSTIAARFTQQESQAVAQVEPSGFEMTRAGRRFYVAYNGTVPTGVAPVQALPTTTPHWTFQNYEPVGGKTYFMQTIGVFPISGTPGVGGLVLASVNYRSMISGSMASGFAIMPSNNQGQLGSPNSRAILRASSAITGGVPIWAPIAFNQPGAAGAGVAGNQIVNTEVQGRIAIPPQCSLDIVTLALAGTTPLFIPILEWVEVESDNE